MGNDISNRFIEAYNFLKDEKIVTSPSDFAKKIDISTSLMTEILKDRTNAGINPIQKTVLSFPQIDARYLLTGNGQITGTKNEENLTVLHGKEKGKEIGNKRNVQKSLPNEDLEGAGEVQADNQEIESLAKKIKFSEGVRLTDFGAPFYPLPVSAGTVAELVDMEERPTGYISIPGVSVKAYFPVVGCSFEPLIRAGDIIGIDFIDKWEILDPDCIYYILTHDQRLIKRLMRHPEDKGKLVCISPNYKEFTLETAEIKRIFKVVFYGRLV